MVRGGALYRDPVPELSYPRQQARTRRFTLGVPRAFSVAADSSRVAFARTTAGDDPVHRLWVLDLPSGADGTDAGSSPGERLVADPAELLGEDAGTDHDLPPEERARRERAREAGGGIVSFVTDAAVSGAVYALAGRLFSTDLDTGETARLPSTGGVFDPRPSPCGTRVAYVSGGSLRVTSLTEGDRAVAEPDRADLVYATAEFVAAEEMRRSRGYWWAPDGERLLVTRVDLAGVGRWTIGSLLEPWTEPSVLRYPAAGTTNATVDLEIRGLDGTIVSVDWNPLGHWEYLADAAWDEPGRPMLVVQTRDQRCCAVLDVDASTGSVTERYRWSDEHWIDIVAGAPTQVGHRLVTVEDRGAARRLVVDGEALTGDDLQIRRVVCADESGVLVVASTDPISTRVARIGWDGAVTMLTEPGGVHSAHAASADPDAAMVVTTAGMDHDGWITTVRRGGEVVATITDLAEVPVLTPTVSFNVVGRRELHAALVLPADAEPGVALPVLVDPYGGPHAQRVQRARSAWGVSQWFADQGFAVVVADGRGTPGRGPAFERAVHGDLAAPVLDDQVDALEALAERDDRLDLDRVAIRGWSFGGYLAALAVLRRPDRFHAAVAGAPVTDWRLYDTHYTERYLGHPDTDPSAYARCDLTAEAASLTRPLLLVHGLADDNVVAAHTLKLSQALLEAGRPHEVLPLSGVTHMTPQEEVAENLLILQLDFIRRSLGLSRPHLTKENP